MDGLISALVATPGASDLPALWSLPFVAVSLSGRDLILRAGARRQRVAASG